MFNAKIEVENLDEVMRFLEGIRKKLIDPSYEAEQTKRYLKTVIFPRRFNQQKNPAGGRWKPSKRFLKEGGQILTDTRNLRNSMEGNVDLKKPGVININMFATGSARKYAAVHNNGLRIPNRSGRLTKMPKRQFAWISAAEKQKIAEDIFLRGLES